MHRILKLTMVAAAVGVVSFGLPVGELDTAHADEKVNQLIIFGDDPCPQSSDDEITVCARKDESERYRIPEVLRDTGPASQNTWTSRVLAYETVGRSGIQSCSPVGAGGWTGCAGKLISDAYAEKEEAKEANFSQLIAAEREKRLATIDEEAAETQARVEEAEKAYDARQRAAEQAAEQEQGQTAP